MHGHDGHRRIGCELFAEPRHEDIHAATDQYAFVGPYLTENLLPLQHLIRIFGEKPQ
jgi:hypothetical protein